MRTIQITIDPKLLERVDQACQSVGLARSAFIRQSLEFSLHKLSIAEREQQHKAGYLNHPVMAGEFDLWENEQAWDEI
jgi:metal-responsive CopG/Arc/MetJ family transcriptional regulator